MHREASTNIFYYGIINQSHICCDYGAYVGANADAGTGTGAGADVGAGGGGAAAACSGDDMATDSASADDNYGGFCSTSPSIHVGWCALLVCSS